MILSTSQAKDFLMMAGFKDQALDYALKIMSCESGLNTNALNLEGENSQGLMQINLNAHPEYASLNLFDPLINCQVAYRIYEKSGNNFQAWSCAKKLGLIYPFQSTNL